MALDKPFLGTGWSFPPTFSTDSQTVEMVSGETDINQSIFILLSTSLRERVMQPTYGCSLKDYQFESVNNGFLSFLRDLIGQALLNHEPRIIVENIHISAPDNFELIEGKVLIEVDYRISETNTRFNFVYDFYRREANRPV